jgi:hypothetical protein
MRIWLDQIFTFLAGLSGWRGEKHLKNAICEHCGSICNVWNPAGYLTLAGIW